MATVSFVALTYHLKLMGLRPHYFKTILYRFSIAQNHELFTALVIKYSSVISSI